MCTVYSGSAHMLYISVYSFHGSQVLTMNRRIPETGYETQFLACALSATLQSSGFMLPLFLQFV